MIGKITYDFLVFQQVQRLKPIFVDLKTWPLRFLLKNNPLLALGVSQSDFVVLWPQFREHFVCSELGECHIKHAFPTPQAFKAPFSRF